MARRAANKQPRNKANSASVHSVNQAGFSTESDMSQQTQMPLQAEPRRFRRHMFSLFNLSIRSTLRALTEYLQLLCQLFSKQFRRRHSPPLHPVLIIQLLKLQLCQLHRSLMFSSQFSSQFSQCSSLFSMCKILLFRH